MSFLQRECLFNPQTYLPDGLCFSFQQHPTGLARVKPVTGDN